MFDKINKSYISRFDELPFAKQFHFSSRIWLWSGDKDRELFLREARPTFCGQNPPDSLQNVLKQLLDEQTDSFGSKNAAAQRAPYFRKYPLLRKTLPLLFRLLFAETVYGIDGRAVLKDFVSEKELDELAQALLSDPDAIAILSTHACNFLYLWHRFYKRDERGFDVELLYEIGQRHYNLTDLTHLQLYIYLYTHCIIGESLFYKRAIPAERLHVYHKMCQALEQTVMDRYDDINLDNKCEILVALAICGYENSLAERIHDEASRSFSPDGDFVIDRHNNNPQTNNVSLDKSEHRNVLLLMSALPFEPSSRVAG